MSKLGDFVKAEHGSNGAQPPRNPFPATDDRVFQPKPGAGRKALEETNSSHRLRRQIAKLIYFVIARCGKNSRGRE
jgi:hypothetical protein